MMAGCEMFQYKTHPIPMYNNLKDTLRKYASDTNCCNTATEEIFVVIVVWAQLSLQL
jgi:hypothetical protein